METETIDYYNKKTGVETHVRVLVFNGLINLYNEEQQFLASYPLKGARVYEEGKRFRVIFDDAGASFIELPPGSSMATSLKKDIDDAGRSIVKKLLRTRILLPLTITIGIVIGMYFLVITLIPRLGASMISKETEVSIGNELKEATLKEEQVFGSTIDSLGTIRVQAFADRIRLSEEYPIRLTLVKNNTVNAYAMPGGNLVVYTGMLDKIDDPDVLVALLAHEASHVNHRHTLRTLLRSAANSLILSIIFGDAAGITATLAGQAETLRGLDYSRTLENEADHEGMKLMVRNRVNAKGMLKLMQILKSQGDVPQSLSFLSSHPLTDKRIRAAEEFIRMNPQKDSSNTSLNKLFSEIKQAH